MAAHVRTEQDTSPPHPRLVKCMALGHSANERLSVRIATLCCLPVVIRNSRPCRRGGGATPAHFSLPTPPSSPSSSSSEPPCHVLYCAASLSVSLLSVVHQPLNLSPSLPPPLPSLSCTPSPGLCRTISGTLHFDDIAVGRQAGGWAEARLGRLIGGQGGRQAGRWVGRRAGWQAGWLAGPEGGVEGEGEGSAGGQLVSCVGRHT